MENVYIYAYSLKDAAKKAAKYKDEGYKIIGIEAEWGDQDLKDSFPEADESLSHHGKFSDNPPPCTRWDLYGTYKYNTCFIFSHFDLDSIYGCLVLEGYIEDNRDMREITDHIGWIDVMGQHRAHEDTENYNKWTYYMIMLNTRLNELKKQKNRDIINEFKKILEDEFFDFESFFRKSKEFEERAYNMLDKNLSIQNKLHVYIGFSNYLHKYYIQHNDYISISDINIMYDSNRKRLSIGTKNDEIATRIFGDEGVAGYLQTVFGDKAGGQKTVGGSPKNQEINFNDFIKVVKYIKQKVANEHYA